jgi:DNA-binding MarR family transcriptional regulator
MEQGPMTKPPGVEDWELLAQFSQAYRTLSDTFMEQIALHRAQAFALCRLFVHEGMTQSELADELGVQGATITNMLKRMEESGLVTRQRDSDDNRLVRVFLTDDGRAQERAITQQFEEMERSLFANVTPAERKNFRRTLRQLLVNMGQGD